MIKIEELRDLIDAESVGEISINSSELITALSIRVYICWDCCWRRTLYSSVWEYLNCAKRTPFL